MLTNPDLSRTLGVLQAALWPYLQSALLSLIAFPTSDMNSDKGNATSITKDFVLV